MSTTATPDETPNAAHFLNAETCVRILSNNMELDFQVNHESWTQPQANTHFKQREALLIVQHLLINEAERIAKS